MHVAQFVNDKSEQVSHIPSFKAYPEEHAEQEGLLVESNAQVSQFSE